MAMNPAPGRRRVLTYVTPELGDILFYELRDTHQPEFRTPPAYGTAHPDTDDWPDHFFVYATPAKEGLDSNPGLQYWYYAARRSKTEQDAYNFEFEGDHKLTRTYIVKRADWVAGNSYFPALADGTADTTYTDYDFNGENVLRIGQKELDSMFVVVQRFFTNPDKEQNVTQSGSNSGERSTETTLGATASAVPATPGVIVRKTSSLTDEQMWENTEEVLDVRTGVRDTTVDSQPGMRVTRTEELSLTEPVENAADQSFTKELVTTDFEGTDAVWIARRETLANEQATGSRIVRDLGGGVATETITLVNDGDAADSGINIISSEVRSLGNGKALKTTVELTGGYPTLVDYQYDEQTSSLIKITKDVVAAGATGPAPAAGDVTEIQAVDNWRSIQIRSQYHPSNPSGLQEQWETVEKFQYPPRLLDAGWLYAWAYAFSGSDYDYAEDYALVFSVEEAYLAQIEGRVSRYLTDDPDSINVGNTYNQSMVSYTIGVTSAWWTAGDGGARASAVARTWQSPLAVVESGIYIGSPSGGGGNVTIDREISGTIPAGGSMPSGWITIDVSTRKVKLGLYEVLVKEVNA